MDKDIELQVKHTLSQFIYAVYDEDKIEILNELNSISLHNPVIVGTFCLTEIIKSLFEMDETEIHYQIIENIFRCNKKSELVEMLFQNQEIINLILGMSISEILWFINVFDTKVTIEILLKKGKSKLITIGIKLFESNRLELHNEYINQLINGIREEDEFLNYIICSTNYKNAIYLMEILLKNSLSAQIKFINSNLFKDHIEKLPLEVYKIILNPQNTLYNEIQSKLLRTSIVKRVENEYEILHKLVYGNAHNLKTILETIDINQLISSADMNYYAAELLDLYIAVSPNLITAPQQIYNVLLWLQNKDIDLTIMDGDPYTLLLIFIKTNLNEKEINWVTSQLKNNNTELDYSFMVLISIIHNIPLSLTNFEILNSLLYLRKKLIFNPTFSSRIDNILVESLSELIKTYNEYLFALNIYNFNEIQPAYNDTSITPTIEKSTFKLMNNNQNYESFVIDNLEKLHQGIENVMKFFKP
ncbi:hypothetical protein EBI_21730 [Enterocytozoon bieneusi H348]|nr:hypothetical protein EBI_21730 [Enterocytozoon bieneusi H348]|eukprot:XP_002649534.1 hypothetical protein EBI_21730 [Enterocytozoon bieneusi H348]